MTETNRWTLLLYIVHSDVWEHVRKSIHYMATAPGAGRLEILVQAQSSLTNAKRFRIGGAREEGAAPGGDLPAGVLEELPPVLREDMTTPHPLTEFVRWGLEHARGDRVGLVVWSHGDANLYKAAAPADRPALRPSPFYVTRNGGDSMTNQEFYQAIRAAGIGPERKLTLLGCDACDMGMIEFAWEFADIASVLLCSEAAIPVAGWPYRRIFAKLAEDPGMEPRRLAETIVREFAARYPNGATTGTVCLSALDLTKLDALARSLDALSEVLTKDLDLYRASLVAAAKTANGNRPADPACLDIMYFFRVLADRIETLAQADEARGAIRRVIAVLAGEGVGDPAGITLRPGGACFANYAVGGVAEYTYGPTIFLPIPASDALLATYEKTFPSFTRDWRAWPDLLRRMAQGRTEPEAGAPAEVPASASAGAAGDPPSTSGGSPGPG